MPASNTVPRYRVVITNEPGSDVAVRVYDRLRDQVLGCWIGETARRLLDSDVLGYNCLSCPVEVCDKRFVRQLMLVAARIQMELERRATTGLPEDPLQTRLCELRLRLPDFHKRVATLLFDRPGHHLSDADAHCLAQFEYPFIEEERIDGILDDLVRWRVIQRIVVDARKAFYDIDTRPHLHVYCRQTNALRDAPSSGVVKVAGE